jgi:hypothetical protein
MHGSYQGELGVLEDLGISVAASAKHGAPRRETSGSPFRQLLVLCLLACPSRTDEPVVLTPLAGELSIALLQV